MVTFFTATIKDWNCLLFKSKRKKIIIDSFKWLSEHNKAYVHAFVIMPNHIHVLWSQIYEDEEYVLERNFLSATAHKFKIELRESNPSYLDEFIVDARDRKYNFWQTNSVSIEIETRRIAEQKLDYIHFNPVSKKWRLALHNQPDNKPFTISS